MRNNRKPARPPRWVAFAGILFLSSLCLADDVEKSDGWIESRKDSSGEYLMRREMSLSPRAEARPALKHRLIADRYDQIEGNSAIYYLKALGYFEETIARRAVEKYESDAAKSAKENGDDDYPPYEWLSTPPDELPITEVQKFLSLLSFQKSYAREAARRTSFSLDRNIRDVENPIAYLLPEIQSLRQLGRYQSLRARLAIAENRIDDAIETIGQQFALAHHLGNDEFYVPNLVGAAVASIAWDDTLHLLAHSDTPNLYWAFASLPNPLIDMKNASSFERQFLFEQVKCLREVTEKPRPLEFWQDFLGRLESQLGPLMEFEAQNTTNRPPDEIRATTATLLAAAYPGARKYLAEEQNMGEEQIDQLPNVQVVLLAMRRYYEQSRDEHFKWEFLPYSQAIQSVEMQSLTEQLAKDEKSFGWITKPASVMLPAMVAVRGAQQRTQQQIALAQTIESIRDYAAANNNELPPDLAKLRLPAPHDPSTGEPFKYEVQAKSATLTGTPSPRKNPAIRYQFVLQIAK